MPWIEAVIKARWLVAGLGEDSPDAWWQSHAMSATGQRFLARLFPRTPLTAALRVADHAAQLEHDARIGQHGVFHLFRLPIQDETAVQQFLGQASAGAMLGQLATHSSWPERLSALTELSGEPDRRHVAGPVRCGRPTAFRSQAGLSQVCAVYLQAFTIGSQAYPFVEPST